MKKRTRIKQFCLVFALILQILAPTLPALGVHAAEISGVKMSTEYPGITAKAGQTVSFNLDFSSMNGKDYDADLKTIYAPKNWNGYFKGKNGEITKVHVKGHSFVEPKEGSSLATYSLTIPADTKEGDYKVKIQADCGSNQISDLELSITVKEIENGMSNLTTTYAKQEGPTGSSFKYDTTIMNSRSVNESYALSASAPEGWQVSFTPAGESANVTSIDVDANTSKSVSIKITPPEKIEKGEYTIPCSAISANDTLTTDLTVKITGTYGVELSTSDGRLSFDAYANKPSTVTLIVTNKGNVTLENLNLNSNVPKGWEMTLSESSIATLEAGASKEITATIVPGQEAITGDYISTIAIKNRVVSSETAFRVSVKTPTAWGIVAIFVIISVFAFLTWICQKYGRR